jgi:hypothetical protein
MLTSKLIDASNCRRWQPRRMVLTDEVIAFSRLNEEILVDVIPLTDIAGVELMQDANQQGGMKSQGSFLEFTIENVIDFAHAFQIRTAQNGYNAGRKYVIQATSHDSVTLLINGIIKISEAAVLKADARPIYRKMQGRMRMVYNSAQFQGIATFLIFAVSTAVLSVILCMLDRAHLIESWHRRISERQSWRRSCSRSSSSTPTAR